MLKRQKTQKTVVFQNPREENFKKNKWSPLSNTLRSSRKTRSGVGEGRLAKGGQKVQISNYKINKYQGCNVQHDDYI